MKINTIKTGSYEVNCSIVMTDAGETFVIDPGSDPETIISALEQMGTVPSSVLLTHAHFDHVSGVRGLQEKWPQLKVVMDLADAPMFGHPFNCCPPEYPVPPRPANLCGLDSLPGVFKAISTPGHTPGGTCYYLEDENVLFSGDTLFAGSVGRTDFPGGSMTRLMESLKSLMLLPDAVRVIPGHGPETTIGAERRTNPYIV